MQSIRVRDDGTATTAGLLPTAERPQGQTRTAMSSDHPRTEKMEAQFKLFQAQLDTLAAKAEIASVDVKAEQRKRVKQLKESFAAARTRFDEMNEEGAEKVEVIKDGFESAWKELQAAFKQASK